MCDHTAAHCAGVSAHEADSGISREWLLSRCDLLEIRSTELRQLAARLQRSLNSLAPQLRAADLEAEALLGEGGHYCDPRCEALAASLEELFIRISAATEKAACSEVELLRVRDALRRLDEARDGGRLRSRPVLTRSENPKRRRGLGMDCLVCGTELVDSQRAFCSVMCQRVYMDAFWSRRLAE